MDSNLGGNLRWRAAWRMWLKCFVLLCAIAVVAGWILTLVDTQYEASPIVERMFVALIAGGFGAMILSPVSAAISTIAAGVAWFRAR